MARAPANAALGLLLPALILFAVINKKSSKVSRVSRRSRQQQERTADECAAAVDDVYLEPAAAKGEEKPLTYTSTTATVTVDADVDEDIAEASAAVDTAPQVANNKTALCLPPLLSKALSFLLHLVVFIVTYAVATYVWPFGSVSLVLVALSSPFVIDIHRWWNKALDEAIGIDPAEVPLAKAAWDKAWS